MGVWQRDANGARSVRLRSRVPSATTPATLWSGRSHATSVNRLEHRRECADATLRSNIAAHAAIPAIARRARRRRLQRLLRASIASARRVRATPLAATRKLPRRRRSGRIRSAPNLRHEMPANSRARCWSRALLQAMSRTRPRRWSTSSRKSVKRSAGRYRDCEPEIDDQCR